MDRLHTHKHCKGIQMGEREGFTIGYHSVRVTSSPSPLLEKSPASLFEKAHASPYIPLVPDHRHRITSQETTQPTHGSPHYNGSDLYSLTTQHSKFKDRFSFRHTHIWVVAHIGRTDMLTHIVCQLILHMLACEETPVSNDPLCSFRGNAGSPDFAGCPIPLSCSAMPG